MSYGNSLSAIQWLLYMQNECDDLISESGNRVKIMHQYYRGEHSVDKYTIDGYALVNDKHVYFEFLGDEFHQGCPYCNRGGTDGTDEIWEEKRVLLEERGTLHFIRECQWIKKVKTLKHYPTSDMPLIMSRTGNEHDIISGVTKGLFIMISKILFIIFRFQCS